MGIQWDGDLPLQKNIGSFLSVETMLVTMLRVLAPFSATEPKLTFRAITEDLRSLSAKLLSGGIERSFVQWYILCSFCRKMF